MSATEAPLQIPRSNSPMTSSPTAGPLRMGRTERSDPLKDYSVLLGLATVGSVLLLHSIGARLSHEWHTLVGPMNATRH